jgi:aspartate/methionine/tyrosine aminotransferase
MHTSAYLQWAKSRPQVALDLALSNVLPCALDDLPGAREALGFDGRNDDGYGPLLEAIAVRYSVPPSRVATATGTSGANYLAVAALLERGDEALVEFPAYDPLLAIPSSLGAEVRRFERRFKDGFALDPDRVASAMTPSTRIVIVTQPHNPSGAVTDDATLQRVAEIAERRGAWLLVDEVYLDAARGVGARPAARLADNIISTNSLTKSYGLAPLRCGWAIGTPEVAERVRRARDIVDGAGSIPAERLAVVAFEHLEALARRAQAILEPNCRAAADWIARIDGIEGVVTRGTIAFPRLRGADDATPQCDRWLEQGVAVVPGRFFGTPAHFRIGLGVAPDVLAAGLMTIASELRRKN